MTSRPHPCAIAERGLMLRSLCASCSGSPIRGQRRLTRGDVLCREGERASSVFLVVDGLLRESILDPDGCITASRPLHAGDIVGFEALNAEDHRATVDALTAARVCEIDVEAVRRRLAQEPDQGLALTRILAADVADLRERLARQVTQSAEERVLGLLRELIGDTPSDAWVRLPVTREQMGQFLGLTLETVSRIVHRLSDSGVLELQGRLLRFAPPHP